MQYLTPTVGFEDKGSQVYNVKAYGAVGDGTTVDSTAFQNAINAAATAGGGQVYAPPGTYVVSNLYLASNVTLAGAGMGATVLLMDPAAGTLVVRVVNGSTTDGSFITVKDLTIDGNKAAFGSSNTTKVYGYYAGTSTGVVTDLFITRVEFRQCKAYACDVVDVHRVAITDCTSHDNGYATGTNNNASGFEVLADDVTLTGCRAYNNSNKGFISGEGGVTHYRTKFIGCVAENNTAEGFYLHDGVTDSAILGGTATGNTNGVSLNTSAIRNSVIGVSISGNSGNGIRVDTSTFNTISNNVLDGNATASSGNPELYFTSGSNNLATGNMINSVTSSTSIVEAGTSDHNTFRANVTNKTVTIIGSNSTVSDGAPDATTGSKGIVQLAGDLAGTATSPTVPGLTGKEPSITAGTTSQYYRGDKSWQALNQDAVPDGTANKAYTSTEQTKLAAITGTNTGDQTSVTGNAGTATKLATARTINNVPFDGSANITTDSLSPADHGLLAWTYDPAMISTGKLLSMAGLIFTSRIFIPQAMTISNVLLYLTGAGAVLTNSYVALYQNNVLLVQSADQSTSWQSSGVKTISITPQAVSAGSVEVAMWCGTWTTAPTLGRVADQSGAIANIGLSAANSRFATADTSKTTTAPTNLGTHTQIGTTWWFGLS